MAQSTNDVFPTTMRVATLTKMRDFLPVLDELAAAFDDRAKAFDHVLKSGRTHMQDAVPIRLGQEFAAYALTIRRARDAHRRRRRRTARAEHRRHGRGHGLERRARVHRARGQEPRRADRLRAAHRRASRPGDAIDGADARGLGVPARPRGRPGQDRRGPAADVVRATDRLRGDHDCRRKQPGSSIMPGKVNPVMVENLSMICYHVIGLDTAVAWAASAAASSSST